MNRFYVDVKEPRPESYKEDLETAKAAGVTGEDAHALWSDLAAGKKEYLLSCETFNFLKCNLLFVAGRPAAESGWDFSSRWMEDGSTLSKTITSKIVPVDLNSVMYKNEVLCLYIESKAWTSLCLTFFFVCSTYCQIFVRK